MAQKQAWTQEPWHVERRYDDIGYPGFIILGLPRGQEERDMANAMRMQACVNACRGLNPEAFPELLEALEGAEEWMAEDGCDCGVDEGPCSLCKTRAALTKARGDGTRGED